MNRRMCEYPIIVVMPVGKAIRSSPVMIKSLIFGKSVLMKAP